MLKNVFYPGILILALGLASCSGNVAPTSTPTFIPPTETQAPTATATAAPPTPTATATRLPPTATLAPSATATVAPSQTPTPAPTDTPLPTSTPQPTLPSAPKGMTVAPVNPNLYAVRVVEPAANIRKDASVQSDVLTKTVCGGSPLQLDAVAKGDASSPKWYHLTTGGWLREDLIKTYPDAAAAQKAAQSAKCTAAPAPTPSAAGGQAQSPDYTPTIAQVWEFTQGDDNPTGTCNQKAPVPPYGPMKITPHGATLELNTKEPTPYTLTRVQPNVYSYTGPTSTDDGTVTMVLTFTGKETAGMSRAFVSKNDSGCTHTLIYTGAYQWDAP